MDGIDRRVFQRVVARLFRGLARALLPLLMLLAGAVQAQDSRPGRPSPPAAAATGTFEVSATAIGNATALWVELMLTPQAADVGKPGKIFVGAWIPVPGTEGAWFLYDGRGWTAWTGGALKPYSSGTLAQRFTVPVLQGLDVRAFHGASLYMGYGTDGNDMLARRLVQLAYTIDVSRSPAPAPGITLVTNPTDRAWMSVLGADRTRVQYFGTRDATGIPQALQGIEVASPDGSSTRIELDRKLRPSRLRADNGTVFELSWGAAQQAQVQATSGDGTVQVSTDFPLGAAVKPAQSDAALGLLRRKALATAEGSADWPIQVYRCGMPYDGADVTYSIFVPGQVTPAGAGMATPMGGGRYVAPIPTGLKPSLAFENLRAAADSMADVLGKACDALGLAGNPHVLLAGMCPYIGASLASVTGPGGVAVAQACTAVTAAVTAYCKVLGEGGVIEAPSLSEKILAGLKDPRVFQSLITLRTDVYVKGKLGTYSAQRTDVPANGPHPSTLVSVEDDCGELSTTNYAANAWAPFDFAPNILLRGYGVKAEVHVGADSVARKYLDEPCCTTYWQVGGKEFRVRLRDLQVDTSLFPFRSNLMGGRYVIQEAARFVGVSGVHKCDGMPWTEFTGTEITLPVGGTCSVTFVVNMKVTQTTYDSDGVELESGVYATGLSIDTWINR